MVKIQVTSQDIRCHYRAMEQLSLLEQHGNDGNDDQVMFAFINEILRILQTPIGWTQLGEDIDGENSGDDSGHSVSLSSDGNIVAIGATKRRKLGDDTGHVRVYQRDTTNTDLLLDGLN